MKYRIDKMDERMHIEIVGVGDSENEVLGAFEQCQEGRCACPTNQYEKLRSLDMETGPDAITLRLTPKPGAKPGEAFEQEEIEKCLDFTIESASADRST